VTLPHLFSQYFETISPIKHFGDDILGVISGMTESGFFLLRNLDEMGGGGHDTLE
jgi:hypothetical protein